MIDVIKRHRARYRLRDDLKCLRSRIGHARSRGPGELKTVCTYCSCRFVLFDVWTKDRHILKVEPSKGLANGISTCVKGKFGWDFVNSPDRLTKPLIREGDTFREATWDEALALVAKRFAEIKAKDGPDALAFISSSKCTNEESYLMQKLARGCHRHKQHG